MAKDFLNVIERALMIGISQEVNSLIDDDAPSVGVTSHIDAYNVYVFGEFPEVSDLKFPAIVVEHTGSGFEEQFMGQDISMGTTSGTGETYGASYTIHIIVDQENHIKVKDANASVTGSKTAAVKDGIYRQRRLLNWLMLNVANAVMDIDFDVYEEEDTQVLERHLNSWQSVGFIPDLQWYGASADFTITFTNIR